MSNDSRPYAPNQTLAPTKQNLTNMFAVAGAPRVLARDLTAGFRPTGAQAVDVLRRHAPYPGPPGRLFLMRMCIRPATFSQRTSYGPSS